jgi:hypothetical protein
MALTVTGTLGGVIITQAANSVSTRGARRKECNDRINDAVGDLIASGTAWVYAVNAYEESMFNAVILNLREDETRDAISSGRAAVHSAQLAPRVRTRPEHPRDRDRRPAADTSHGPPALFADRIGTDRELPGNTARVSNAQLGYT